MEKSFTARKRVRKYFGRLASAVEMPNLIEVQKTSHEQFLQRETDSNIRTDSGLQEVFKSVFPIESYSGAASLDFATYKLGQPAFDVRECRQRGLMYSAPLHAILRLMIFEKSEGGAAKTIRDVKEQEVYMGEIPLMTENGTFIINGTERVVVSQMHRSPGVFFDHDKGKTHS